MWKNSLKTVLSSRCFVHRNFPKPVGISTEDIEKIKKFKENEAKKPEGAERTYNMLKNEFAGFSKGQFKPIEPKVPHHVDFVILGGGIIGSSIAYFMKQRAPDSFDLMVVEQDPKYTRASTTLSVGGIRQQFSLPENIQLSLFSAQFLRNVKQHLSVLDEDPPDIQFQPHGYLFLASEAGVEQMIANNKVQKDYGARIELLRPKQLKEKFPWLNVDGIEMGAYGLENEGWFDPWALLSAFKKKACSLGAKYVHGEVIAFEFEKSDSTFLSETDDPVVSTNYMYVKDEVGEVHCVEFGFLIVAAGPHSGEVARMLKIGEGPGLLKVPFPVEPRKRYVYTFNCEKGPGLDMPLVIDPTGAYVRREGLGGKYICGRSPAENEEPDISDLEVDYNFFDNSVWPVLANRIPIFEGIKVSSAWAGYYDYNTLDQNALFGYHPYFSNILFATGFSGHGIQMAPAIGRAMMEVLVDKKYKTINLSRFHLNRIFLEKPLYEKNIV